ncbi:MAG TPA: GatB/YqeY domain-containing protein [Acidimicrobiia bacterium]|nr:GatB/YqeY domain-containing protein [Acidimicrobiia bacterium]
MSIAEELRAELRDAMRAKDKPRLNVVRGIETEVARTKAEPGFSGEVDDDLYRSVIGSYVKKMDKAREEFVAAGESGRANAEKLAYEIEYLGRWLPSTLGEDETREIVRAAIAEIGPDAPVGRVIGQVMKSGREGLDGALVNRLVREELGS